MIESLLQSLHASATLSVVLTLGWTLYIIAIAIWIVWEKREPAATLGWLLSLAALPLLGFIIYHFFGPRRIKRYRLRRLRARAALDGLQPEDEGEAIHAQWASLAERTTGIAPVHMLTPRLLRDGEETYGAMLEAIAGARDHIHLTTYIFEPDETGRSFRKLLVEKARSGVAVRLLLDSVGSSRLRQAFFKELLAAGGELAWFHPVRIRMLRRSTLNLRNHRKILIVDGQTGFTGGVNISDIQDHRRRPDANSDLHLRFQGSAVQALQLNFLEDWAYVTGNALYDDTLWPSPAPGGAPALILPSGPDSRWEAFHRMTVELIHDATERVWLVTPYFVPTEATRMALTNAALSGLDVRIMLPQQADSWLVSAAARSYYNELLVAGVRIFEYKPSLLHAKAMLVDREHLLIGSANFDSRSFRLNFELSALVADRSLAAAMEAAWHDYAGDADEVHVGTPVPWTRQLVDAAVRPLSPLL